MIIPIPGGSGDLEARVAEGQHSLSDLKDAVRRLEQRVEKQTLMLKAMCSLLLDRAAIAEADLLARVQKFAAEKTSESARTCPACGRTMNAKHNKCMYCGEARRAASALDLI